MGLSALDSGGRAVDVGPRVPLAGAATLEKEAARQLGVPAAHVRDAVSAARRRGLLTATRSQGVPGGELTAKAHALFGTDGRRGPTRSAGSGLAETPIAGGAHHRAAAEPEAGDIVAAAAMMASKARQTPAVSP